MPEKDPFAEARARIKANQEAKKKAEEEAKKAAEREARREAQRAATQARIKAAQEAAKRRAAAARVAAQAARPKAISKEALMERLESLAAGKDLNWKQSIVDLLKLLGLDSSFAARKALAQKLGCPAELMSDSAKMNTWLHEQVLERLAAHGGEVPPELK